MKKQFIIVRGDLPPGAQAVQSCHAMKLFTREHPEFDSVDNLALLSIPTEGALADLKDRAEAQGWAVSAFHEPDFDDQLTAIGIEERAYKLVSCLPKALRGARKEPAAA